MKIVSLAEVKAKLSAYLQEAEKSGPVVVTRNGKAVAFTALSASEPGTPSRTVSFGGMFATDGRKLQLSRFDRCTRAITRPVELRNSSLLAIIAAKAYS